jgi:hypothetical protein
VCVCVCVYVCMFVFVYTSVCWCTYARVSLSLSCSCVCVCVCVYVRVYLCLSCIWCRHASRFLMAQLKAEKPGEYRALLRRLLKQAQANEDISILSNSYLQVHSLLRSTSVALPPE